MTRRNVGCMVAVACAAAVFAAGCGVIGRAAPEPITHYLPKMQAAESACHKEPLAGYVAQDLSATGVGNQALIEAREHELEQLTMQVAACGGYVQAVGFSAGAANTVPFGEASFPAIGSEDDTARLVAAHKTAGNLLAQVHKRLPIVVREVGQRGTDVLAQLQLASQFAEQHSGPLTVLIETDGIATRGPVYMETSRFTKAVAEEDAQQVPVPTLPGAVVQFVGIGRTSAPSAFQISTARVEALIAFYKIVCQRMQARCLVTTDYAQGDK